MNSKKVEDPTRLMQPFPSRRERATIEEARTFHRAGGGVSYSSESNIAHDERLAMVESLSADLLQKIDEQFPKTDILEYAILKAHLLVEYCLEKYIACMSFHRLDSESLRLTFAQKLDVAAMLGFGGYCALTIPSIELLNRVRNQVAHRFSIDRSVFDELYSWWAEDPDTVITAADIDRIQFLNWFTGFVSGSMAGQLRARTFVSSKTAT